MFSASSADIFLSADVLRLCLNNKPLSSVIDAAAHFVWEAGRLFAPQMPAYREPYILNQHAISRGKHQGQRNTQGNDLLPNVGPWLFFTMLIITGVGPLREERKVSGEQP